MTMRKSYHIEDKGHPTRQKHLISLHNTQRLDYPLIN